MITMAPPFFACFASDCSAYIWKLESMVSTTLRPGIGKRRTSSARRLPSGLKSTVTMPGWPFKSLSKAFSMSARPSISSKIASPSEIGPVGTVRVRPV
jgi:hypothetical protein